ncbi:MAG: hypothetical protein JO139_12705 [Alphaproteobacteria bacterium]|nr:hypothetical protein [Alphaproteobacteria bacterium]
MADKHPIETQPDLVDAGPNRGRGNSVTQFAASPIGKTPSWGVEWMRALKTLVVVMGIMLIGGFAVLVAAIMSRVSRTGSPSRPFTATAIDIPREARIETMTAGSDRLVLDLLLPDNRRQLLIIDLTTGARVGTVELHPMP